MISNFHAIIFEHHQIFQEVTAPHVEKKGYSLVNAHCLQNMQALSRCCTWLQQQVKSTCWNSLHTPNSNFELAKRKSFVRPHSCKGLFKIYSVHFASDGFERTVYLEGAPRRLIAGSTPTRVRKWTLDLSETGRGIFDFLSSWYITRNPSLAHE